MRFDRQSQTRNQRHVCEASTVLQLGGKQSKILRIRDVDFGSFDDQLPPRHISRDQFFHFVSPSRQIFPYVREHVIRNVDFMSKRIRHVLIT